MSRTKKPRKRRKGEPYREPAMEIFVQNPPRKEEPEKKAD